MSSQDAAHETDAMLAALRAEGADRFDSLRFHAIEVLARRTRAASGELQRLLSQRLQSALTDHRERFARAREAAGQEPARAADPQAAGAFVERGRAPLAALNAHLREVAALASDGDSSAAAELRSLRRFRQAWSRISAEDRLERALGRGPGNAGPLNSHMLVLRALAAMRQLSPDYLRRFLGQLDTLLWLEAAQQGQAPLQAKPARRGRQRK